MIPLGLLGIGALGGALFNRRDPLKGALLGAGLGAAGGAFAPGLFGGAAAMPAAGAAEAAAADPLASWMATGGMEGSIVGGGAGGGAGGVGGGLFGAETMAGLEKAGKVAGLANMAGLLAPQDQPMQQAPAFQPGGGGAQTLAALAQQGDIGQQISEAAQRRRERRIGLLG